MIFTYIAPKYEFHGILFFGQAISFAKSKYAVFWGVIKIRIGKLVAAKLGKSVDQQKINASHKCRSLEGCEPKVERNNQQKCR